MEQMATVVGVGRQTAYAQCRLFLATDGNEGIPCHRIGRLILIYRAELERWLGFPILWPPLTTSVPAPTAFHEHPTVATSSPPLNASHPPRHVRPDDAPLLNAVHAPAHSLTAT